MLKLIKNLLWSPFTVLLVAAVGIIIGARNKFRAIKNPKKILQNTIFSHESSSGAFEAMCTALGGTIGVGNTIGVAGAITEGGAGALFWMIVASFFGMIIKESEIFLAVKYKGMFDKFSGPMLYIERGIGNKYFAVLWSISCVITAFGMGNLSQSMAAVSSINAVTNIKKDILGIAIAIIVFSVVSNGLSAIKKTLGACIPVITVLFVGFSLVILYIQRNEVLPSILYVFKSAFNFRSGISGVKWSIFLSALRAGFSRGIFTNEAGLGSACIVHSSSNESTPERQASWGVLEVFIDTVLICTITGLMILSSNIPQSVATENLTLYVFGSSLGKTGSAFYAVSILIFAISSILAWYFYAECSLKYLGIKDKYIKFFKIIFALSSFLGGIINAESILYISDIFNAIMLITNLTAIVLLSNETKSN